MVSAGCLHTYQLVTAALLSYDLSHATTVQSAAGYQIVRAVQGSANIAAYTFFISFGLSLSKL